MSSQNITFDLLLTTGLVPEVCFCIITLLHSQGYVTGFRFSWNFSSSRSLFVSSRSPSWHLSSALSSRTALNKAATAEAMSVDRRENTCPTPYKTPAPPRPHTQPILPHCRLNHSSIEHHHHACANEAMRQHFRLTSFAIYRQPSKVPSASPARASR